MQQISTILKAKNTFRVGRYFIAIERSFVECIRVPVKKQTNKQTNKQNVLLIMQEEQDENAAPINDDGLTLPKRNSSNTS
jgi:hypothetical protein